MKFTPPEDDINPFNGCSKTQTTVVVVYPIGKAVGETEVLVNCWIDKSTGATYLSSATTDYLDRVKAYYWYKMEKPSKTEKKVIERALRLYNLLNGQRKIAPHVVLNEADLASPSVKNLLYRAILDSTVRKFNGTLAELLDEVYEKWL